MSLVETLKMEAPHNSITWFDFSQVSLDLKKDMMENWDGKDYPAFVRQFCDKKGMDYGKRDLEEWEQLWEEELDLWGGQSHFISAWKKLCGVPQRFCNVDLIQEPEKLCEIVKDEPRSIVLISNIYDYQATILQGSQKVTGSYVRLLEGLQAKTNNIYLDGGNLFGERETFFVKECGDILQPICNPFV